MVLPSQAVTTCIGNRSQRSVSQEDRKLLNGLGHGSTPARLMIRCNWVRKLVFVVRLGFLQNFQSSLFGSSDPDDVVDIFAGSNTTGSVAETEGRKWLSFDESREYLAASVLRFVPKDAQPERVRELYDRVLNGEDVELPKKQIQRPLLPPEDMQC